MTDSRKSSRVLTRRNFIATSSAALVGGSVLHRAWGQTAPAAAAAASAPSYVTVDTSYGKIRGAQGTDVVRFKGIPYGGSLSGPNRFKAAPPLQPWTGVRDALQLGPPAMQPG